MYVANHAVRRYAERVLNVQTNKPFHHAMLVVYHQTGLTTEDIRQRIRDDVIPGIPATVLFRGTRRVIRGVHARYVVNQRAVHTCYVGNENDLDDEQ